uniref:SFRICE_030480 n=1 Tax=Spodoptera frugiperda TaxID=7108 RepID=A0A2H1VTY8_SPOFR
MICGSETQSQQRSITYLWWKSPLTLTKNFSTVENNLICILPKGCLSNCDKVLIHTYIISRLSPMGGRDNGTPIATHLTYFFRFINSHQSFHACSSVKGTFKRLRAFTEKLPSNTLPDPESKPRTFLRQSHLRPLDQRARQTPFAIPISNEPLTLPSNTFELTHGFTSMYTKPVYHGLALYDLSAHSTESHASAQMGGSTGSNTTASQKTDVK